MAYSGIRKGSTHLPPLPFVHAFPFSSSSPSHLFALRCPLPFFPFLLEVGPLKSNYVMEGAVSSPEVCGGAQAEIEFGALQP